MLLSTAHSASPPPTTTKATKLESRKRRERASIPQAIIKHTIHSCRQQPSPRRARCVKRQFQVSFCARCPAIQCGIKVGSALASTMGGQAKTYQGASRPASRNVSFTWTLTQHLRTATPTREAPQLRDA
eukprot:scaffold222302_cov35-Tisochrysis_lutea.AAC.3